MKVIIDNNIVIDALNPNEQFEKEAQEILRLSAIKKIDGFVTANSLTDIFYVLQKRHGVEKTKTMTKKLVAMLGIVDITATDCVGALDLSMDDFEDAVVSICAKKVNADYIVSRDEAFIKSATEVKVIKPHELLSYV
ncbi:DNA-binding protein [Clostridia bacterium]|nr:DNA-binding protein [Clostridia bacterium]